jgi:hypothetical protein
MNPILAESIIIYRSQMEQNMDQFWTENPDYILYIFLGCGLLFFGVIIYSKIVENYRKNKWHKY